jgi:hypothetical protein
VASTLLNERGFPPDLIEMQLAHLDSRVRAIYNRSVRLEERRKMMQAWADYLDDLKAEKDMTEPAPLPANVIECALVSS